MNFRRVVGVAVVTGLLLTVLPVAAYANPEMEPGVIERTVPTGFLARVADWLQQVVQTVESVWQSAEGASITPHG